MDFALAAIDESLEAIVGILRMPESCILFAATGAPSKLPFGKRLNFRIARARRSKRRDFRRMRFTVLRRGSFANDPQ